MAKKLQELNPGFDGKVTGNSEQDKPIIENGVVTRIAFVTADVTDISPVRALTHLHALDCRGSWAGTPVGKLTDLWPLRGMSLTTLRCPFTKVFDLSPLKGMPLTVLFCDNTAVSDLSPLQGMPLTILGCGQTTVHDLLPLKDMKLASLYCHDTGVFDLSPLRGMPLTLLECDHTSVRDLSPLQGMLLTRLTFTPKKITRGLNVIRQMRSPGEGGDIDRGPRTSARGVLEEVRRWGVQTVGGIRVGRWSPARRTAFPIVANRPRRRCGRGFSAKSIATRSRSFHPGSQTA